MRVVNFAELLGESIDDKINESRIDIHESDNHTYKDRLLTEIWALEWSRG
jgi:hypothetical protein